MDSPSPDPSARADRLEAAVLAAGHALTPQRRAIVRWLAGRHDHPTAAMALDAVTRDFPLSSRATVYNTLGLLVEIGAVTAIPTGDELRYDPNPEPHHHLRCRRCGGLQDVPLADVTVTLRGQPTEARVEFAGICAACS